MATSAHRISAIVRSRRQDRGLSRDRLAQLCKVSVSTISRLELQDQLPATTTMFALARVLDLDLNDLADLTTSAKVPAA